MTLPEATRVVLECVKQVKPNLVATEAVHKEINTAIIMVEESLKPIAVVPVAVD